MKGADDFHNKTKALKLFFPILIYSLAFLITDYLVICTDDYQDIVKYFRKYYCGLICLYMIIIALSYYLDDVLSWIYLGILGFTLNILFLFSDNVNLYQFNNEAIDTSLRTVLTFKYWVNIGLMFYLILMVSVMVHSQKKLIMSSLTEDLSRPKEKAE